MYTTYDFYMFDIHFMYNTKISIYILLSFVLPWFAITIVYQVATDIELVNIEPLLPVANAGLGFFKALAMFCPHFHHWINIPPSVCSCLKIPCLVHIVDSLTLNSPRAVLYLTPAWSASNTWIFSMKPARPSSSRVHWTALQPRG